MPHTYSTALLNFYILNFLLQGRSLRVSYQQSLDSNPVPPPPKLKSDPSESSRQENDNILNSILPPR